MKWVKASDKMPELYPVNATHELHFKLDGRKIDGFFLHSQCFEYFDPELAGYKTIEADEFRRVEYLDESPSKADDVKEVAVAYSHFVRNGYNAGAFEIVCRHQIETDEELFDYFLTNIYHSLK